jgi:hypothetical protein
MIQLHKFVSNNIANSFMISNDKHLESSLKSFETNHKIYDENKKKDGGATNSPTF